MTETEDCGIALKRARMRAWRRGMRETDLILGGFIDRFGQQLNADELSAFETLLDRRDSDIYGWVAQPSSAKPEDVTGCERALLSRISETLPKITFK